MPLIRERWRHILLREGSSRTAGLLRIGLALIALARFAQPMLPYHDHSPKQLVYGALFYASTLWLLVGYRARYAAVAAGTVQLGMTVVVGFHHHTYLLAVATMLLALTSCDRSYALDRWFALRRGQAQPERGPTYGYTLIALQITAVYFWGVVDKLYPAFIDGTRMEQYLMFYQFGSDYPEMPGFRALVTVGAIMTLIIEVAVMVMLWIRRCRRWAIALGMTFHAIIYYLLPVDTFTIQMWLLYLAFVDPDEVHAAIDQLHVA